MNKQFKQKLLEDHIACKTCPTNQEVTELFSKTIALLYPHFQQKKLTTEVAINSAIQEIEVHANWLLSTYPHLCKEEPKQLSAAYIEFLPVLYEKLNKDVKAIYLEDPAAKSFELITRTYPGFYAISAYRIAHWLHQHGIELIPRIITEHAHSHTGIDIHPAAEIGDYFCIDHGTGVVIGETTNIGNNVKIYQGVTLGAIHVHKEEADKKRHPTIEDNVIIYANATILGGNTIIGEGSLIGGNAWITESIAPASKVYYIDHRKQVIK